MPKRKENYLVVGLGNPGDEYTNTRHNVGWMALDYIAGDEEWEMDGKLNAYFVPMSFSGSDVTLIKPTTFMNRSGVSVLLASKKFKVKPENVIVIYDDMDLGLGSGKISFNRGSGGHRGVESIIRSLKTKAFTRIRVGISPVTPGGKVKKPKGEKAVLDFILKDFRKSELETLKKFFKKINETIDIFVMEGRERATNYFN